MSKLFVENVPAHVPTQVIRNYFRWEYGARWVRVHANITNADTKGVTVQFANKNGASATKRILSKSPVWETVLRAHVHQKRRRRKRNVAVANGGSGVQFQPVAEPETSESSSEVEYGASSSGVQFQPVAEPETSESSSEVEYGASSSGVQEARNNAQRERKSSQKRRRDSR